MSGACYCNRLTYKEASAAAAGFALKPGGCG